MRSFLLIFAVSLISVRLFAQEPIAPRVKSALYAFHPTMEDVSWVIREDTLVAGFQRPEGWTQVFLDQEGKWLETRIRTAIHLLPEDVRPLLREQLKEREVSFIEKVNHPQQGIFYRIVTKSSSTLIIGISNAAGNLSDEACETVL